MKKNNLVVKNLSYGMDDNPIITNLSFSLKGGEAMWLKGHNGAGKTTLLKILAGLWQANDGKILWQDHLASPQKRQGIAYYLGHEKGMREEMSVVGHLALLKDMWGDADIKIPPPSQKKITTLSAGMKKQLQLAGLYYASPKKKLWLLDEPLVSLDNHHQEIFTAWLQKLLARGGIIIFTHHGDDIKALTKKIKILELP